MIEFSTHIKPGKELALSWYHSCVPYSPEARGLVVVPLVRLRWNRAARPAADRSVGADCGRRRRLVARRRRVGVPRGRPARPQRAEGSLLGGVDRLSQRPGSAELQGAEPLDPPAVIPGWCRSIPEDQPG